MRITRPLTHASMLQIAGKGGCVVCAFLKNQQSEWLEHLDFNHAGQLCNYHGWAIAAAADGKAAAEMFLRLLREPGNSGATIHCELCERILVEEESTLKDLTRALLDPEALDWLERNKALCLRHAERLACLVGAAGEARVLRIAENAREQLKASLRTFISENAQGAHSGGGALGRAAELLFGYRGLPRARSK
jgi:hypothetical protein